MIIYSERRQGDRCDASFSLRMHDELVLQAEPWRTMLANVLADYALEVPFSEPHTYRLDRDDDNERWLVKAEERAGKRALGRRGRSARE